MIRLLLALFFTLFLMLSALAAASSWLPLAVNQWSTGGLWNSIKSIGNGLGSIFGILLFAWMCAQTYWSQSASDYDRSLARSFMFGIPAFGSILGLFTGEIPVVSSAIGIGVCVTGFFTSAERIDWSSVKKRLRELLLTAGLIFLAGGVGLVCLGLIGKPTNYKGRGLFELLENSGTLSAMERELVTSTWFLVGGATILACSIAAGIGYFATSRRVDA